MFKNRTDAGRQLAARLGGFADQRDLVVLGIPRGGVVVAYEVATVLHAPLDVFLSRKLGVPGNPELAFGAVAAEGGRYLDPSIIRGAGINPEQIERITQETRRLLDERARAYRRGHTRLSVAGKTVILVDDGIATGASAYAAIQALKQMKPAKVIVAAPVAPSSSCEMLEQEADLLVILDVPENFYAVGQCYENFDQVSDDEVIALLSRTSAPDVPLKLAREVSLPVGSKQLQGILSVPRAAKGIVVFAHGSGSSRHSPRNQHVAEDLQSLGLATLLFDLMTSEEELRDSRTAALRFDIPLLASRLIAATEWVRRQDETMALPIGYFGASTGASAALVAAAQLPNSIRAVVSRGGRPDLAGDALGRVRAATLLLVGGKDDTVLELNRRALDLLQSKRRQMIVVPGATHLFEEPGALEQVAALAGEWFLHAFQEDSRAQVVLKAAG